MGTGSATEVRVMFIRLLWKIHDVVDVLTRQLEQDSWLDDREATD